MRAKWSRREVLRASLILGGASLVGCSPASEGAEGAAEPSPDGVLVQEAGLEPSGEEIVSREPGPEAEQASQDSGPQEPLPEEAIVEQPASCSDPFAGGTLLGTVPFINEGGRTMNTLYGEGWDGRLYTDLSEITADSLILPNEKFFVRTRYPDQIDPNKPWVLELGGLVEKSVTLSINDLTPMVQPMGTVLLECSGNGKGGRFGLLGAANWSGVPIEKVLAKVSPKSGANRVLISGFDQHSTPSTHSTPGASWIFTVEQLKQFGAFLATQMNGVPLPKDHGFPVRLIMPRWYGCTNIKWVDSIQFVDDTASSTAQMKEFASRTHQVGVPALAKDYKPAVIDQTAMPLRVEKWEVNGKVKYKVVGVMWGGERVSTDLVIRFKSSESYQPVDVCPVPNTNNTWSLWSYAWEPKATGSFAIQMQISDASVPKKRLDSGFYIREVKIEQV
ncbi:MAG: hypothetical protein EP343_32900 [Deltaproteobacteria bacterium]|nr:MAG: hypothetical protein EP343_32900 [Deltaproteobacteria bacterium]